jgi:histidyl-tRNA synthetase
MSSIKPRTMPGVLELLPLDQIAFQGMLDTIRRNYERFGFLPVETPAMEYSEILLTKSGGETERQVYFVESTGTWQSRSHAVAHQTQPLGFEDQQRTALNDLAERDESGARDQFLPLPELALRFDLTVPLARYVAEHEHDLSFPFRRYQIQRVYRGERAQRGRFREFYQCDIDVIGKDHLSIRYDAEMPAVIHSVFRELDIGPFQIQLNNRKLIRGFFEGLGIADGERQMAVLREVDKLDKRGADAVRATLEGADFGLPADVVGRIMDFVSTRSQGHDDALACLDRLGRGNDTLAQGADELREVLTLVRAFGVPETHYALNFSIARGLDYYTGTVYETHLVDYPQIGSICSGGRYDNLASQYTRSKLPGVGISIGATRLFWQLREAKLIGTADSTVQVLVTQMDEADLPKYLDLAGYLRAAGIPTEVQMEPRKLAKQFQYADRAGIRFVAVLGPDEQAKGVVTIKDLRKQDQFEVPRGELVKTLRVEIEQAAAMKRR